MTSRISRNRLEVGLRDRRIREAVERMLTQLRIPRAAVLFSRDQPIVRDSSVQWEAHRPFTGGLQIAKHQQPDGTYPTCTLGFVAWSQRQRRWGFVTNSHCTDRQGGVESTRFFQPRRWRGSGPEADWQDAGTEVDDPSYYTCYIAYDCRYSDSAFVAFPDWFTSGWGQTWEMSIARAPGDACCTLAYNNDLRGPIVREAVAAEGHNVAKRGRTTGFTVGKVTDSCDDSIMKGGFILRCQFTANYASQGGDSGGPVFIGEAGQAYLLGIHVGRGSEATYSPIGNIQRGGELGFLYNCRDFNC